VLSRLRDDVEGWRANRESPKSRVPEDLWERAVEVARTDDGTWKTSKAIRFNYQDLQRRVASASRAGSAGSSIVGRPPEFVEVPATPIARAAGGVVVEVFGTGNERMRIEADARALDVSALLQAFWSREP
jgi:hypothetical protein